MDFDVLDSLDDLGYSGSLQQEAQLQIALKGGSKSPEFTQLIEWFSKELQALCGLDSCVNSITDAADSSSFLLEVSSFLKELQCPYKSLLDGPISQRLLDTKSRLTLLDYLCTELEAARLLTRKTKKKNCLEIEVEDSVVATSLGCAMRVLNIDVNNENMSENAIATIQEKVQKHVSTNPGVISEAAFKDSIGDQHWHALNALYREFLAEYTIRRELLLTRLDVTIQSFKWGEGSKGKENEIVRAYMSKRKQLKKDPSVQISDILASRESIMIIEKASSAKLVKNTKSSLNRILIPAVPDRGGRPREQRPPVEMPSWMKRSQGGDGRGRGNNNYRGQGKKFRGGNRW